MLHIPADDPFLCASPSFARTVQNNAPTTPLEASLASFAIGVAHQARVVLSCRRLGTGRARDVSGVVRVSRGGSYGDEDEDGIEMEEGEWLYHVRGDGSVKVWSRGAAEGY